jgi:beta-lactamase class A
MQQFTGWAPLRAELAGNPNGITWSVAVDRNFVPVLRVNPDAALPSASIGKIFILMSVLEQVDRGTLTLDQLVDTSNLEPVADSGIMQYLNATSYSIADLCVLTAGVSDNRAANALMELVGIPAVQEVARNLGFERTRILDYIRDSRGPEHPSAPSCANAGELLQLVNAITKDYSEICGANQLRHWLSLNTDTGMVASAFYLDPLAHGTNNFDSDEKRESTDVPVTLWNKTGTDTTVRADCGSVTQNGDTWTYAVLATWERADSRTSAHVMKQMHVVGALIAESASITKP